MRKLPPLPDPGAGDDWILTYADAITLLMAFFVMLFSISKVDQEAYTEFRDAIKSHIGHIKAGPDDDATEAGFDGVSTLVERLLQPLKVIGQAQVVQSPAGLIIEIPAEALFDSGSAVLRPELGPVFERVAWELKLSDLRSYAIDVEGHTDDSGSAAGNWSLSSDRAIAVVQELLEDGIEPARLRAVACGDTRPKRPNRDSAGTPIAENRAANRRVLLLVHREPGR